MKKQSFAVVAVLVVLGLLLAACGPAPAPQVVQNEVTRLVPEKVVQTVIVEGTPKVVEKQVTQVVEVAKVVTATPNPSEQPTVGGKFTWALQTEPPSLNAQDQAWHTMTDLVLQYIGQTLVAQDPNTGEIVPSLAESWKISDDGLTYDFKLRQDVKFHDGTPLTAKDYAWTFNQLADPKSTAAAKWSVPTLASAEAVDDSTLRLHLSAPYFPMLRNLTLTRFQPLPQAAVEKLGDKFARQPVGVGPYKFKEWTTGEKIVLERNPDYAWAPAFLKPGGPYLDTIEFQIIPDYATAIAGMETGQFDFYWGLDAADANILRSTGKVQILEGLQMGGCPSVIWDASQAPLSDLRVRQALNLATDRDVLVRMVALGYGAPNYGPVSSNTIGYWPGVEQVGYHFDLTKAKALMAEAGYTVGKNGMLEKDGQPLKVSMKTNPEPFMVKAGEVLKEQWAKLGVDLELQQMESGLLVADYYAGKYQTIMMCPSGIDIDNVIYAFLTKAAWGLDVSKAGNPELDGLIAASRAPTDPAKRQEAVQALTEYLVKNALEVPLYSPMALHALNTRIQGAVMDKRDPTQALWLTNAYVSK